MEFLVQVDKVVSIVVIKYNNTFVVVLSINNKMSTGIQLSQM